MLHKFAFMQVQAQLLCTKSRYCDFIVYTKQSVHIERVEADIGFAEDNVPKAKTFFQTALLPELLGKWFSRPPKQSQLTLSGGTEQATSSSELKYCYCQQGEHGDMVGCDNAECPYQWFHLECLHLHTAPKSRIWYCPDCRKLVKCKKN